MEDIGTLTHAFFALLIFSENYMSVFKLKKQTKNNPPPLLQKHNEQRREAKTKTKTIIRFYFFRVENPIRCCAPVMSRVVSLLSCPVSCCRCCRCRRRSPKHPKNYIFSPLRWGTCGKPYRMFGFRRPIASSLHSDIIKGEHLRWHVRSSHLHPFLE